MATYRSVILRGGIAIAVIVILILLTSCSRIQYVPIETVRIDTTYISKVKKDSVYVQDSVYVHERGDTIFINKTKIRYIERLSRDTVYKYKTDTIIRQYPIEKELTSWQRKCMKVGEYTFLLFVFGILALSAWVGFKVLK